MGQNKQNEGKGPNDKHKKNTQIQRYTHLHPQDSYKNTNPEAIVYMQKICKRLKGEGCPYTTL